jgi:hypothetical protein
MSSRAFRPRSGGAAINVNSGVPSVCIQCLTVRTRVPVSSACMTGSWPRRSFNSVMNGASLPADSDWTWHNQPVDTLHPQRVGQQLRAAFPREMLMVRQVHRQGPHLWTPTHGRLGLGRKLRDRFGPAWAHAPIGHVIGDDRSHRGQVGHLTMYLVDDRGPGPDLHRNLDSTPAEVDDGLGLPGGPGWLPARQAVSPAAI